MWKCEGKKEKRDDDTGTNKEFIYGWPLLIVIHHAFRGYILVAQINFHFSYPIKVLISNFFFFFFLFLIEFVHIHTYSIGIQEQ